MPYFPSSDSRSSEEPPRRAPYIENKGSLILKIDPAREYLPSPNPIMVAGGWLALLTVVTSLIGCWLIPYQITVKAPAQVRSDSEPLGLNNSAIPSKAAFSIQAWVPNNSINSIDLDQQVQIRLNSCPYPTYGTFKGRVIYISKNTITGEVSGQASINLASQTQTTFNSYKVLIQPETSTLEAAGKKSCELRAGMEGRADILVGQERLLSFLMQKVRL